MNYEGTLDVTLEGWGFVRQTVGRHSDHDAYVSQAQIRRFHLKPGDVVSGEVRPPRLHEGEKYYGMVKIDTINGREA